MEITHEVKLEISDNYMEESESKPSTSISFQDCSRIKEEPLDIFKSEVEDEIGQPGLEMDIVKHEIVEVKLESLSQSPENLDTYKFSSNSDEDPTYYPSDSDSEDELKPQLKQLESLDKATLQCSLVSTSSVDKLSCSGNLMSKEVAGAISTTSKNSEINRIRDFCLYCESDVLNFGRHIFRKHSQEIEVQKIFTMKPNCIERKRLIATLRKRGNHVKNHQSVVKPVHRTYVDTSEESYAACQYCFGYYSRKLLWKHIKKCPEKKDPPPSNEYNFLLSKKNLSSDLITEVFPRMRRDKISLNAKRDSLICAFGGRYLNTHREQHHINICSRKMRELSKVLMESKKTNPEINNFYDLLHPQNFNVVVQSVQIIAKYDAQNDVYRSPTFATNISATLKDCCDIAISHFVKRKYCYQNVSAAEAEANVNSFKKLLESAWKLRISSQGPKDLYPKPWNKTTIIALASDLKLLQTHLIEKGNEAERKLKEDSSLNNYRVLMETVFCRLLLLNRRGIGELQRIKLTSYTLGDEKNNQSYEEFSDAAMSASEKILLKSFQRMVIRGEKGRGVPIVFSKDIQKHMEVLIENRQHFQTKKNLFLFARTQSDQPIVGYKTLQTHAQLCGARNPQALTSSKLRKHSATLSQLFNMSQNEIGQLATFMGRALNVHSLSDDVYQTAKIAKLLLLIENGQGGRYKGKTLEEIDLNLEEDLNTEYVDEKAEKKVNKRELVKWTEEQKKVVKDFFKNHIKMKKAPKKAECDALISNHPDLLENKSWLKIKVFVQNLYKSK